MKAAIFAVALAALLLLVAACTAGDILASLAPFPCAKDGTCPTGYQCQAGAAGAAATCISSTAGGLGGTPMEKALDELCSAGDLCKEGACEYGVCSPSAATSNTMCPLSHPVNGEFACLLACNSSADCGPMLACISLPVGYGGALAKGCVSPALAAFQDKACTGNTPGECGATSSPYSCVGGACELSCGAGSGGCPSDRVCKPPNNGATTLTACFYDCEGGRDGGASGGNCPPGATQCTTFTGDPGSYCSP
jgi:hypothetical protein